MAAVKADAEAPGGGRGGGDLATSEKVNNNNTLCTNNKAMSSKADITDKYVLAWTYLNVSIFFTTVLFTLPLINEVINKYEDADWHKDMTRMCTAVFTLMSSSYIVALLLK